MYANYYRALSTFTLCKPTDNINILSIFNDSPLAGETNDKKQQVTAAQYETNTISCQNQGYYWSS